MMQMISIPLAGSAMLSDLCKECGLDAANLSEDGAEDVGNLLRGRFVEGAAVVADET